MASDNVTSFPNNNLNDIPFMLRFLAQQIENGEQNATSAIVIIPQDGDWPDIFGFGAHLGDHGNIAICEMAKIWFVNNLTQR